MTDNSRIIASQDLTTAGFYEMADEWSDSRKIDKFGTFKIRDSYNEASGIIGLQNGDKIIVTWVDQGTHLSTIGDVGSDAGNTPNSGYYVYNSGLQKLVRTAPLEAEVAENFSNLANIKAQQTIELQNSVATTKIDIDTKYNSIVSTNNNVNSKAEQVSSDKDIVLQLKTDTLVIRNETLGFSGGKIKATYTEATTIAGLVDGDIVAVLASDTGTHTSVAGDVGASSGQTPNSGYYRYSATLTALVRVDSVESIVAIAAANAAAASAATIVEDITDTDAQFPNLLYREEVDVKQNIRVRPGFTSSLLNSTYLQNGTTRPCFSITAAAGDGEKSVWIGPFYRSEFGNQTVMSLGVQLFSLTAFVGAGTNTKLRVMAVQVNSVALGGVEISGTRQETSVRTTGGITTPEWCRFVNVPIHADMDRTFLFVGLSNNGGTSARTVKFGEPYIRPGNFSRYSRPNASAGNGGVVNISPTGNDSTGTGSVTAPFATFQPAINAINTVSRNGTIYVAPGTYPTMTIDAQTIVGDIKIIGQRTLAAQLANPPLILGSSKLTGITKTSGRTKVYQTTLIGPPTNTNFNWAYQDGVVDPRSLISSNEREPEHRGRTNRLHRFTKIIKTTATTLSAALSEIDSSSGNDPKAFIDDTTGILYFSIVGGGDGSAANIYMDGPGLIINNSGNAVNGMLTITDIEFRYGGVDLRSFRHGILERVIVHGSRADAVQYSDLLCYDLEVACAGSQNGATGDGLNGHYGANLVGFSVYTHDNRDDGFSDHEYCSSRINGFYAEYNGGAAVATAYGADGVIINGRSRKNVLRGVGHKSSAFLVVGDPSAGGPPDGGVDTRARFENCISIDDPVGFHDDGETVSAFAECVNCKVFNNTGTYGYNVTSMRDCGWSSNTGVAKKSSRATVVTNASVVT